MKKFLIVVIVVLSILIFTILSLFFWLNFSEPDKRQNYTVIPPSASLIVESNDIEKSYEKLKENNLWNHANDNLVLKKIRQKASLVDSLFNSNNRIGEYLKSRKVAVSAHQTKDGENALLYSVDLGQHAKLAFFSDALQLLDTNYDIEKLKYGNHDLTSISPKGIKNKVYFSFIDNLLVFSENRELVNESIEASRKNIWKEQYTVFDELDKSESITAINLYINHLKSTTGKFILNKTNSGIVNQLFGGLLFSGFDFEIDKKNISLHGKIIPANDSVLSILSDIKPSKIRTYKIVSSNVAFYVCLTFDSFKTFQEKLFGFYQKHSPALLDEYKRLDAEILENYNINTKHHIFSWIGNEISFLKINKPKSSEGNIMLIHAKDIEMAKERLAFSSQQLFREKSEISKGEVHNNYQILPLKSIAPVSLLAGQRNFSSETLYFTSIRSFIVLADNKETLRAFIDDYVKKDILLYDDEYKHIVESFDNKSNVFAFVNFPKAMLLSKGEGLDGLFESLDPKRDILANMKYSAIQLSADKNTFDAKIKFRAIKNAIGKERADVLSTATFDELLMNGVSNHFERLLSWIPENTEDGEYGVLTDNNKSVAHGNIEQGKPDGTWKTYFKSGKLESIVNWKKGMPDGIAIFFYDTDEAIKKAEFRLENGSLHGKYREYSQNGLLKASLNFDNGQKDGIAHIYDPKGNIKLEGRFEKDQLVGDWKLY